MQAFLLEKDLQTKCEEILVFSETKGKNSYYILLSKDKRMLTFKKSLCDCPIIETSLELSNNLDFTYPKIVQRKLNFLLNRRMKYLFTSEGIMGIFKDNKFNHLVLIQKSEKVGQIFQHDIRKVSSIKLLELFIDEKNDNKGKTGYVDHYLEEDLKNFYFSRSYNIMNSLQMNMLKIKDNSRLNFIINKQMLLNIHNITSPLLKLSENSIINHWCLFFIDGYFSSYIFEKCSMVFESILLNRRETQNLGTRYNRRGFNDKAFVANYVEVEQILINKTLSDYYNPVCSSYVQMRGSVPIYWYQNITLINPKPQIKLISTAESLHAFRIHMSDLTKRYGPNIRILNLLFSDIKSPRRRSEAFLNIEYKKYFKKLCNDKFDELDMVSFDLKKALKEKRKINKEIKVIYERLKKNIGKFTFSKYQDPKDRKKNFIFFEIQKGMIRSNCVDCIDRTNIAQTIISRSVFEEQLNELSSFKNREFLTKPKILTLKLNKESLINLEKNWENLGNKIAYHYAGSKAHNIKSKGKASILVKRYLCNVFADDYKQNYYNTLQNDFSDHKNVFNLNSNLIEYAIKNKDLIRNSQKSFFSEIEKYQKYKKHDYYVIDIEELQKILGLDKEFLSFFEKEALKNKIKIIERDLKTLHMNNLIESDVYLEEKTKEFNKGKIRFSLTVNYLNQKKNQKDDKKFVSSLNNFKNSKIKKNLTKKQSFKKLDKNFEKKIKLKKPKKFFLHFSRKEKFEPFEDFNLDEVSNVNKITLEEFMKESIKVERNISEDIIDFPFSLKY